VIATFITPARWFAKVVGLRDAIEREPRRDERPQGRRFQLGGTLAAIEMQHFPLRPPHSSPS